jgi:hypothetical protein
MLGVSQACAGILVSPAPILLADTCALLDVVRAPQRHQAECIAAAKLALRCAKADPRRCVVVCASVVASEFADNVQTAADELVRHLTLMDEHGEHLQIACTEFGLRSSAFRYRALTLPQMLRQLAESLLAVSLTLNPEQGCMERA